jgi:hypothetical protein
MYLFLLCSIDGEAVGDVVPVPSFLRVLCNETSDPKMWELILLDRWTRIPSALLGWARPATKDSDFVPDLGMRADSLGTGTMVAISEGSSANQEEHVESRDADSRSWHREIPAKRQKEIHAI